MLHPDFRAFLDLSAQSGAPGLGRTEPEEERRRFRETWKLMDGVGPADVATRDLEVAGDGRAIPARLFTPSGAAATSAGLVHFHGGGFVIGDVETYDAFCRRLAAASGARVMSVEYGLAPEHPFPVAHRDALASTRWAFENAGAIGFDPARIGIVGDSAGGNLSAATAIAIRDETPHRLKFQALLYPAVGAGETASAKALGEGFLLDTVAVEFFNRHLGVRLDHPEIHRIAPIAAPSHAGLPPAYIVTAGYDPLKDDGALYAAALERAGVAAELREWPGFIHGFFNMSVVSTEVGAAIDELAAAVKRGLA